MLNTDIKQDLCQISLTGTRALILLELLINAPRSLAEIRKEFIKCKVMDEEHSDDIIRIDINTLKIMGCEISRADKRTDNKYVLLKHPFELDITNDEINILKRVFKKVKEKNTNIELLTRYDRLFRAIASHLTDKTKQEQLLGLSPLKQYPLDIVTELQSACTENKTVVLMYKAPAYSSGFQKEVIAQELVYKNDKMYLYGYDINKKESVTLNIKRILKILSNKNTDDKISSKPIIIKFKLTDFGVSGLNENEKILCGDAKDGFIIEGKYHNNFVATQRILSFGSACTVYEPQEFKENIITIIKKIKEIYNG